MPGHAARQEGQQGIAGGGQGDHVRQQGHGAPAHARQPQQAPDGHHAQGEAGEKGRWPGHPQCLRLLGAVWGHGAEAQAHQHHHGHRPPHGPVGPLEQGRGLELARGLPGQGADEPVQHCEHARQQDQHPGEAQVGHQPEAHQGTHGHAAGPGQAEERQALGPVLERQDGTHLGDGGGAQRRPEHAVEGCEQVEHPAHLQEAVGHQDGHQGQGGHAQHPPLPEPVAQGPREQRAEARAQHEGRLEAPALRQARAQVAQVQGHHWEELVPGREHQEVERAQKDERRRQEPAAPRCLRVRHQLRIAYAGGSIPRFPCNRSRSIRKLSASRRAAPPRPMRRTPRPASSSPGSASACWWTRAASWRMASSPTPCTRTCPRMGWSRARPRWRADRWRSWPTTAPSRPAAGAPVRWRRSSASRKWPCA